jgi:hypothetical protein
MSGAARIARSEVADHGTPPRLRATGCDVRQLTTARSGGISTRDTAACKVQLLPWWLTSRSDAASAEDTAACRVQPQLLSGTQCRAAHHLPLKRSHPRARTASSDAHKRRPSHRQPSLHCGRNDPASLL